VTCSHCGLVVPPGLVEQDQKEQFCCAGCRTANAILRANGLEQYYDLPQQRERPVRVSGRAYEEFDHPAFRSLYVTTGPEGTNRVELYHEGVHCASCVWLVERVPLLVTGVVRAELQVRRSLATVEWDPSSTPLSSIARTLDSLGYPSHPFRGVGREAVRRREDRAALAGIGVAGALAMNVMLASLALYSGWWDGMETSYARFFRWTSLLLTLPALAWPGRVFFTSAIAALRTRTLHMDLPIALALAAGFTRGVVNTVTDTGPVYFDGVAMLVFLLLVGRYLQARGQRTAADSAELLYALTPSTAHLVVESGVVDVPAEALMPGQLVEIRAGDTMPADGVVESGTSSLNVSLLTGESHPVRVREGDEVYAGTLNVASPIRVRVTAAAEQSRVTRLVRQVEESSRRRAPVVLVADRLAGWFTAAVLVLAAAVYVTWLRIDPAQAIDNAIALLVVTCPCALALATPLAVTAATGRAARRGIFIKGGEVLEQMAKPARLLLDKTGTVTEGAMSLVRFDGPEWVKPLIVALESGSTHPIAAAFRSGLGVQLVPDVEESRHVAGGGIVGRTGGHQVAVGTASFVLAEPDDSGRPSPDREAPPHLAALTPVVVAVDGKLVARAWFGDAIRADAPSAVAALRGQGWDVSILSGDAQRVVDAVAGSVGIEHGRGAASPEDKLAVVEEARRMGRVVMVGDGVNDAAAIAAASVGIGVHGGAEASLAAADAYLTRPGLASLVELADGSRRTMRIIRRGIAFSLVYNVAGVALAATGVINPLIAAVLMPASSLTVLLSAWRGRTFVEDAA
jgi:Cu2+-exporting ATPase